MTAPLELSVNSSEPPAAGRGLARPVAVDVRGAIGDAVRRWVEGVLGWQAVDAGGDGLVPPTVRLVGVDARVVADDVPCILLVADDDEVAQVADTVIRLRPTAALQWPGQRDELAQAVLAAEQVSSSRPSEQRLLRVGGVAGGVGTTTVVLGLAGLAGWAGTRTLATIRSYAQAGGVPVVAAAAIASPDLWSRLPELDGVTGARAVRIGDPSPVATPTDPRIELAVIDHGVDLDVDVVVCRPDAAAMDRLPGTTAAAIVVVGDGPVPRRELGALAGGRRGIYLPWSARVARAGLHGRVPGSLPGAWLRRLAPLVPAAEVRASEVRAPGAPMTGRLESPLPPREMSDEP